MFSNLKIFKLKGSPRFKVGDSVEVEGMSLIIFGFSMGSYLAWASPGGTIYRIE